jgi:hypothetical protein
MRTAGFYRVQQRHRGGTQRVRIREADLRREIRGSRLSVPHNDYGALGCELGALSWPKWGGGSASGHRVLRRYGHVFISSSPLSFLCSCASNVDSCVIADPSHTGIRLRLDFLRRFRY